MSEQDVLARLRHRAVGRGNDEHRAVHLGGTGDHVLDVVGVTRSINVRVVALLRRIFRVMQRDGDATRLLFRSIVDLVDLLFFLCPTLQKQNVRDRRGQRGLAMIDVANRTYVEVRLGPVELFFFCHSVLKN